MCRGPDRKCEIHPVYPDEPPPDEQSSDEARDEVGPLSIPHQDPWDAFVPDDDHEPQPEPGDFWWEE